MKSYIIITLSLILVNCQDTRNELPGAPYNLAPSKLNIDRLKDIISQREAPTPNNSVPPR